MPRALAEFNDYCSRPSMKCSVVLAALALSAPFSVAVAADRSLPPPVVQVPPSMMSLPDPALASAGQAIGSELIAYLDAFLPVARTPGKDGNSVTFRENVAAAVRSHPDVRATTELALGLAFATQEVAAGRLPQLTTSSEASRRRFDDVRYPNFSGTPERVQQGAAVAVTARQLLYDFGAVDRSVEAGERRELAGQARLDGQRSALALRAVTAFYEHYRARTQLALARRSAAAQDTLVQYLDERFRVGGGTQADVVRARAKYTESQAQVAVIENRLRGAEAAYLEAFGTRPKGEPQPPDLPLAVAGLSEATSGPVPNPSLREAEAIREAARAEVAAARARGRPTVSAELSFNRRDLAGNGLPGTDTSALILFRHNLYTGGADTARIGLATQRRNQSMFEYDATLREVERALQQALADVENGERIVAARMQTAEDTRESLRAVREQFVYNRGSLLDLLRSQEELYLVTRDLIDSVVDRSLARYRLLHVTPGLAGLFGLDTPLSRER
jgi:adhesin transport system outer membrane protein